MCDKKKKIWNRHEDVRPARGRGDAETDLQADPSAARAEGQAAGRGETICRDVALQHAQKGCCCCLVIYFQA